MTKLFKQLTEYNQIDTGCLEFYAKDNPLIYKDITQVPIFISDEVEVIVTKFVSEHKNPYYLIEEITREKGQAIQHLTSVVCREGIRVSPFNLRYLIKNISTPCYIEIYPIYEPLLRRLAKGYKVTEIVSDTYHKVFKLNRAPEYNYPDDGEVMVAYNDY